MYMSLCMYKDSYSCIHRLIQSDGLLGRTFAYVDVGLNKHRRLVACVGLFACIKRPTYIYRDP